MYKVADIMYRIVLLSLASSGMRRCALTQLEVSASEELEAPAAKNISNSYIKNDYA